MRAVVREVVREVVRAVVRAVVTAGKRRRLDPALQRTCPPPLSLEVCAARHSPGGGVPDGVPLGGGGRRRRRRWSPGQPGVVLLPLRRRREGCLSHHTGSLFFPQPQHTVVPRAIFHPTRLLLCESVCISLLNPFNYFRHVLRAAFLGSRKVRNADGSCHYRQAGPAAGAAGRRPGPRPTHDGYALLLVLISTTSTQR